VTLYLTAMFVENGSADLTSVIHSYRWRVLCLTWPGSNLDCW